RYFLYAAAAVTLFSLHIFMCASSFYQQSEQHWLLLQNSLFIVENF
ncbi:hypothetical protein DOY81_003779, partial [Sarcophaga bullata]